MRLIFVGDVMLGRLVNDALKHAPPEYPWGDTRNLFRQASWRMCNLECAISDRGSPWSQTPKAFHFRSDAKNVQVLKSAQIDAVSLANNHALDYGEEALIDTLQILDKAGVARAGAGRSAAKARAATVSNIDGIRIGVLAFSDNMPEWEATDEKAGVYYAPTILRDERTRDLLARVEAAARDADILVVSAHWGGNWGWHPPPEHVALGQAIIDRGADVLFGHSAHVFRGVEFYKDRPILYSTGDFIDDYAVDPQERNDWSFVFIVEPVPSGRWRVALYPTVIEKFRACHAVGEQRDAIVEKMASLCDVIGTQSRWKAERGCLELG